MQISVLVVQRRHQPSGRCGLLDRAAAAAVTGGGVQLARLFERVDVFACPTLGVRAPAGLSVLDPVVAQLMGKLMRFAAPFDFSGSPTISLPCGLLSDGVPASLQLVGRHFEETTLIMATRGDVCTRSSRAGPIPSRGRQA